MTPTHDLNVAVVAATAALFFFCSSTRGAADCTPIAITDQPKSQTVLEGCPATFAVGVAGTSPYSYQWWRDGQPIPDGTNSTFTIAVARLSDSGKVRVTIANGCSQIESDEALLQISLDVIPPRLLRARSDATLERVIVTFSVGACGWPGLDSLSSQDPYNYSFTGGLIASNALLDATGTNVVLSTSRQTPGMIYSLTVKDVADLSGNLIPPDSKTEFQAWLADAQSGATSGLYQIISGRYSECCGLAGSEFGYDVPHDKQSFVRFAVDAPGNVASITFLASDMQTVFSTIPCPPSGAINYSFDHGLVFSDRTVFHVDPGPPPYQMYWNYTVSNSANRLRIDGTLGTVQSACADMPTRFNHSNVVAVLMPPPRLSITGVSSNDAALFLQGHAGHTNVIEASTDLVSWVWVSTNVMDYSLCPICPFAIFEDAVSTNLTRRFYRAFEIP